LHYNSAKSGGKSFQFGRVPHTVNVTSFTLIGIQDCLRGGRERLWSRRVFTLRAE
jgi:hypothetical protein